jgi:hypothetical protein
MKYCFAFLATVSPSESSKLLTQVIGAADSVTRILNIQSELALATQQSQIAATEGAEDLVGVMKQLATTTRLELQSINDTAITLKQNLIANDGLYRWLISPTVYGMLKMVLKGRA